MQGIGFFGALFLILLTLKLTGVINIGFVTLFVILFAPLLVFGILAALVVVLALLREFLK